MLHGQTRFCLPSLFLEELPEELLRRIGRTPAFAVKEPPYSSGTSGTAYAEPVSSAGGWRIGQNVRHARFGPGVIVSAEGRGPDARVQVNFGAQGMKWLALEYAKLTPA